MPLRTGARAWRPSSGCRGPGPAQNVNGQNVVTEFKGQGPGLVNKFQARVGSRRCVVSFPGVRLRILAAFDAQRSIRIEPLRIERRTLLVRIALCCSHRHLFDLR